MRKPLPAKPVSDSTEGRRDPRRRSALFSASPDPSNQVLARTLLNEMMRSGRTRSQMIDFVNCFLELVVQTSGRQSSSARSNSMVDTNSGLPNRRALHDLFFHELDPGA